MQRHVDPPLLVELVEQHLAGPVVNLRDLRQRLLPQRGGVRQVAEDRLAGIGKGCTGACRRQTRECQEDHHAHQTEKTDHAARDGDEQRRLRAVGGMATTIASEQVT